MRSVALRILAWSAAQLTHAADIFSFGVLLWEACTMEQPINRRMRDIEPGEAPQAIRDLFRACVEEDPDARPSAKAVLETLLQN